MTVWTEYVKRWAKANNTSYGCAVSNKECRAGYALHKKRNPADHKERVVSLQSKLQKSIAMRQLSEVSSMGAEDRRAKLVKSDHASRVLKVKAKRLTPSKPRSPKGFNLTDFE